MKDRLGVYGSAGAVAQIATVGVGKSKSPHSLVARMPSADVVAKVGTDGIKAGPARRIVRLNTAN